MNRVHRNHEQIQLMSDVVKTLKTATHFVLNIVEHIMIEMQGTKYILL